MLSYFLRHVSSVVWKRRPIQLTFFVTRRCNSRCSFCFYLADKGEGTQGELDLDEIERFSASLGNLLWLLFSGGEVYLREDIAEISEIFYRNNKPAIITLPTNALLPELIVDKTEDVLRRCRKSVVVVKLSLDGLHAEHDALRGVKGNFDRVMQTYRELLELVDKYPNFELGVNTVFCRANQDRMKDIIAFVGRMPGIRTHTVSLIRGDPRDPRLKDVDMELYRESISMLEEGFNKNGIYRFRGARFKTAQDILQRRLIYRTVKAGRRLIPCYAGRLNLVVTETGDVYPCEILTQRMGNIRDYNYDFKALLNSQESMEVKEKIRLGRCYCSHECYFVTNILFNPRMYMKLFREYLKLVLSQ